MVDLYGKLVGKYTIVTWMRHGIPKSQWLFVSPLPFFIFTCWAPLGLESMLECFEPSRCHLESFICYIARGISHPAQERNFDLHTSPVPMCTVSGDVSCFGIFFFLFFGLPFSKFAFHPLSDFISTFALTANCFALVGSSLSNGTNHHSTK